MPGHGSLSTASARWSLSSFHRLVTGQLCALTLAALCSCQVLDDHVERALARLVDAGIPVLNQSVLLRGVNDSAEALIALSQRLIDLRVMPYYLHQLDPVAGAAHFEVPIERGRRLIESLRAALPGYAVPRYVQEIPGEPNKVVLM